MIKVICTVNEVDRYRNELDRQMLVKSNPNNQYLVDIYIGNECLTVCSEDLLQAIQNVTRTRYWPDNRYTISSYRPERDE